MSDSPIYDALLVLSFGGPEGTDDVMPYLENVLRGRNVPEERKLEVAHHYKLFDGVSPINAQNRELIAALEQELTKHQLKLPIFWGNRNWHPLLPDTLRSMVEAGVKRALVFVTSAYSSYSGCRQYREDIERAQQEVGARAPVLDKLRVFYNHPGFVSSNADHIHQAINACGEGGSTVPHVLFTGHSIPLAMSKGCNYVHQLKEHARLIADFLNHDDWSLVYQSRSGTPAVPWLGPDICDALKELRAKGMSNVVIAPIGFLSDHMEVVYDLDTEARELCAEIGINMVRAATVGTHPVFVSMIRELIQERLDPELPRRALGDDGPSHDVCPTNCCLSGRKTS